MNITQIPAPRVALIDERTGLMSREWYRFFLNLFALSGSGSSDASIVDLQVGPPGEVDLSQDASMRSQLASMQSRYDEAISAIGMQPAAIPAEPFDPSAFCAPAQVPQSVALSGAVSGNGFPNIRTSLSLLLGSYEWTAWNPSDVVGTGTNAPNTGTADDSSYATAANSSGTVTITFNVAGKYLVSINDATAHAQVYTYDLLAENLGGTATRRFGNNSPSNSGDSVNDFNRASSITFEVIATAGQTLTILPTYYLSGAGVAANHTAYANVTHLFCGA